MLRRIKPEAQSGLEIGALDRPQITAVDGAIRYVDYTTTDELRCKHATTPSVDVRRIVNVDFVWGEKTLSESTGGALFDYVVASHVIEHVTDLIRWFQELASVLRPNGVVSLIVPDMRFTFDRLRQTSQLSELVDAYLARRRKPSVRQIFDYLWWHAGVDANAAWNGAPTEAFRRVHADAYPLDVCRDAVASGAYVDAHCWVFTPASFFELMRQLSALDLFQFRIAEFFPTERGEIDFFGTLELLPTEMSPDERRLAQLASSPQLDPAATSHRSAAA